MNGARRVLYRLDKLQGREAAILVEGEKDADVLWGLNLPATTSVGGAGKWSDDYAQQLYYQESDFTVVDAVTAIAKKRDIPNARVALAWILQQPGVTAPIVGATKMHHLDDAVEGVVMHHGDAEHAPRDEARLARHVGIVARIAARVVEADGLAVDRHPAGDALADRESYTVDHPVAKRTRDAEGELAPLLIVDDERRVLGRHRGGQAGEDRVQRIGLVCDAFEVRPRRELGRDGGGAPAVVLVERAAVVAALEVDRPENALLPAHRHDEPLGAHDAAHGSTDSR